ncbi:hypothetical protein ACPCSC_30585 [Streptomyces lavendulocolor]|uniref:hypothetical protein n=1 Tax=Streptomyces lavendulocolor TaxID=67316 RepID=UPI003C2AD1FF
MSGHETAAGLPPYLMRPPRREDEPVLGRLLIARRSWLAARGLTADAPDPAAVAEGTVVLGLPMTWTLWEGQDLVGYTQLFPLSLGGGWTYRERSQPSLSILATWTHPLHRADRPSRLMAWWVLDFAARHQFAHVRRAPTRERLARCFRDEHGWEHRRTRAWPDGITRHLMTRESQVMPGLAALIATFAQPGSTDIASSPDGGSLCRVPPHHANRNGTGP